MNVYLNPRTKRLSLETDHKAEMARHMRSMPKPTLRLSDDHLFGEHR